MNLHVHVFSFSFKSPFKGGQTDSVVIDTGDPNMAIIFILSLLITVPYRIAQQENGGVPTSDQTTSHHFGNTIQTRDFQRRL